MKIFMLIKKLRYSGAYKMFMWLAKALADHGMDVTVCTYMENMVDSLPSNITWVKMNLEGQNLLKQYRFVKQMIKEADADVSISFLLDANLLNLLACRNLRTKSVVCERNDPFKPHYYRLKLTKCFFSLANGAVFQLPKVAEYYSMIKAPTVVIPNPVLCNSNVKVDCFQDREDSIVTLGRLDIFQKRHDVLIKAFARISKRFPTYKLYIYGDGPDEKILKSLVASFDLKDRVLFPGVTSTPQNTIARSKIFVLSSDFEGIPNSLVEAMAIGLPCVSTDCSPGGARFLISDGKNGMLVPRGDDRLLAEKIELYINNPQLAEVCGRNACNISSIYGEEIIVNKWISYLNSL